VKDIPSYWRDQEEFDYIVDGWQDVEYIGYGSYKCSNKGKPYQILSDDKVKELESKGAMSMSNMGE
jgi:hypothetical protein